MSATTLSEAYATAYSAAASPDPLANCTFIQAAIDSGRHVLFPAGTYRFSGTLTFGNGDQRTTFLAGAVLEPADSNSYVLITGDRQTFEGLRIEAASARSPLLEIYGAADLLMEGLIVSATNLSESIAGPKAAVRVMNLVKCNFIGGRISGDQEAGTVGLWLASSYDTSAIDSDAAGVWPSSPLPRDTMTNTQSGTGAYEVGALGLQVDGFGWAVRVGCICDDPSFFYCAFTNNVDGGLIIRDDSDVVPAEWVNSEGEVIICATPTTATGLNLVGCHFNSPLAQRYVELGFFQDGNPNYWKGGAVIGCTFGEAELWGLMFEIDDPRGPGDVPLPSFQPLISKVFDKVGAEPEPVSRRRPGLSLDLKHSGPKVVSNLSRQSARLARGLESVLGMDRRDGVLARASQASSDSSQRSVVRDLGIDTKPLGGFGGDRRAAGAQPPPSDPPQETSGSRSVFRVLGTVSGVVVSGCRSNSGAADFVWDIEDAANPSQSCDLFNTWGQSVFSTGGMADRLVRLSTSSSQELTVTGRSVSLDAGHLGFFGTTPGAQDTTAFTSDVSVETRLDGAGRAPGVLAKLIADLQLLGMVR